MKRTNSFIILAIISFALVATIITSCSQNQGNPTRAMITSNLADPQLPVVSNQQTIMAYYDSTLFNIMLKPFPENADSALIHHNHNINTIYMQEPGDTGAVDVLDAIQRDGFNPIWREVDIVFNSGFPPHQFYSDNQVLAAAGLPVPEIHLDTTNELYVCSVVGPKHHGQ